MSNLIKVAHIYAFNDELCIQGSISTFPASGIKQMLIYRENEILLEFTKEQEVDDFIQVLKEMKEKFKKPPLH